MALDVTALADFNNGTAAEYLEKAVNGGSTMEFITVKEGIKYKEPIGQIEVDLVIQNGDCVTTPSGSGIFSNRDITVTPRVSYDGICLDKFNKKALGISDLEPGSYNETFGLVDSYASQLVKSFQKSNDQFLWNATDGLRLLVSGSTSGVVVYESEGAGSGSVAPTANTILDQIDEMYIALDEDLEGREDLTVFMSPANFKTYKIALRKDNNFHYNQEVETSFGAGKSVKHPTLPITVVGTIGLSGSNRIVMGPAKEIVAGTDLLTDLEQFQLWYDINDDQLKHRIKTKLGVQIAFPEHFVTNDLA